jgi:hypothetical protein
LRFERSVVGTEQ